MAGGKLLLGSKFIARLGLEDGELAALIGMWPTQWPSTS
jgi:hypothetical protein